MRSLDEIATMTTQGHEENEYGSDVRMLQRSDTVQIALFFLKKYLFAIRLAAPGLSCGMQVLVP